VSTSRTPRIAIVLSGGGARGAYEAGVLAWITSELPARLGRPVRFSIASGSSVGAIHACYLAGHAGETAGVAELPEIWRSFEIEKVLKLTPFRLLTLPGRLVGMFQQAAIEMPTGDGPRRIRGVLDFSPLERVILSRVPWSRIRENVTSGAIDALAVATTEVRSGRTVIFVENRDGRVDRWAGDPFVLARAATIGPEHAMASAAIPLVFPAIGIGDRFFCDGSLRLNTPLSPALRLGADRVLVIGLHYRAADAEGALQDAERVPETAVASPAFLAGKVLNALLLDRVDYDAAHVRLMNAILEEGQRIYGPDFIERINVPIVARRGTAYRIVRELFLRPSHDLGMLASECLAHRRIRTQPGSWLARIFLRYAERNTGGEADFLSYLYFDGCYASHLIELGMADAAARADELVDFFGG
jgi:NTE family protein